jgi:hypothetical protein
VAMDMILKSVDGVPEEKGRIELNLRTAGKLVAIEVTDNGKGTTIYLKLPIANTPDWFVHKLIVRLESKIVILDDDQSIQEIWRGRFLSSNKENNQQPMLMHFSTPADVEKYIKNQSSLEGHVFLFDYELLGQEKTGLDLIEQLNLGYRAILVTSHYEEIKIRERCLRLRVKMIPKPMAAFVPIEYKQIATLKPDAVLIDDDTLVHKTWEMGAKLSKKNLVAFKKPEEFLAVAQDYDLNTPIYIDQNLSHGVEGVEIAKTIKELGFFEIYLCTGENPDRFKSYDYIKGVLGKSPPW